MFPIFKGCPDGKERAARGDEICVPWCLGELLLEMRFFCGFESGELSALGVLPGLFLGRGEGVISMPY